MEASTPLPGRLPHGGDEKGDGWQWSERLGLTKWRTSAKWKFWGAKMVQGKVHLIAQPATEYSNNILYLQMDVARPGPAPEEARLPPGCLMVAGKACKLPTSGAYFRWEHEAKGCFMTMQSTVWGNWTIVGLGPTRLDADWPASWYLYLISPGGNWWTARLTLTDGSRQRDPTGYSFSEVSMAWSKVPGLSSPEDGSPSGKLPPSTETTPDPRPGGETSKPGPSALLERLETLERQISLLSVQSRPTAWLSGDPVPDSCTLTGDRPSRLMLEAGPPWNFRQTGAAYTSGFRASHGALLIRVVVRLDEPRCMELTYGTPFAPQQTEVKLLPYSLPLRWLSALDALHALWPEYVVTLQGWD